MQVFDALEFYFMNMEITTTELGDALAMREDSNNFKAAARTPYLMTMLSSVPIVNPNIFCP
ncbi:hypothetical protein PF005_g22072 [Phytophthora fragariae]|uniref:Uncharacterized protein n=1 Tax=Phytophthora fragariae TaxID=53985 RepID=A0A6A3EAZ1_9STRA|nr:hypothetical protein PF003_g23522 [Phytophthora fragariae]KAE8927178.1 hypothetical protein PF009_g22647 [Phytophthora fragariae]KAE8985502.1 hypothetical protein PF011_g20362 [Phytophthora fragariae]KAE9081270.1 hypothetical protein PF007_g22725 [Phytophthora fragariae]KAE9084721.1 hypothetical protein PF010_g20725 [Phytophthora fragariae]